MAGLSACLCLLLAVASSAASLSLSIPATDAVIGQTIHATAQLSETPNASGEISFEVFGPEDPTCSGPPLTPSPASATVSGEGEYPSGEFTPLVPGDYRWSAHYSGDLENPPADSICSAVSTVEKASPELTGTASDGTVNTAIHDEVTLTGGFSPTGKVIFRVYGPADTDCLTPLETDAVPIEEGQATSGDFIPQQAGEFRWTAHYAGDENNESIDLPCGSENQSSTVAKASPTLGGTATSAIVVGSPITDSVTLAGGFEASGLLVFRAYGPGDTSCAGAVKYEATVVVNGNGAYSPSGFSPAAAGTYRWTVHYGGDENNEQADLVCNATNQSSTVSKASPTLAGTATSAAVVGSSITDNVTLAGGFEAEGELVFRAYGPGDTSCAGAVKYEATVVVNGNGAYSPSGFSPAAAGTYRWTVAYAGDENNESVALPCGSDNQSSAVSKASPSLTGTASSAVVGSSIADSVTLAGGFEAGGQLVFRAYGPGDTSCAGAVKYEATVVVNGNGAYSPSGFSPAAAGTYRWTVAYSGDSNNGTVGLACNAANQSSTLAKASPTLTGTATSAVAVGSPIADNVTLAGAFEASGLLVFRAYGPGDASCGSAVKYEEAVNVNGNGPYSTSAFSPATAGLYRWTAHYSGDGNNGAVTLPCDSENQSSAVGTIDVTLSANATSGTVGDAVTATASIQEGAIPAGQITFEAYSPDDANCTGATAFSSTVSVSGNGSYRSTAFGPTRVGAFRWTVSYSGDPNHAPATVGCGQATSTLSQAKPSIASAVAPRLAVGTSFQVTATLQGGYAPGGTISFQIYGPKATDCAKPLSVDTATVSGNGTILSDPIVAQRPGLYTFVTAYSGDAANQAATEPCDPIGQTTQVHKRIPKVKPRARLKEGNLLSIRARLSGAASPSGVISFRLYRPGDERCRDKPAFSGGVTAKSNGTYLLAQYYATKSGTYRLSVGYSGDQRNRRYRGSCRRAQSIQIG